MPKTVTVEGVGDVEFPDSMTEEQIVHAIETDILPRSGAARRLATTKTPLRVAANADRSEPAFQAWYAERAARLGLDADPDNPQHKYDYRAAFAAGAEPDESGHWPSEFKADDHPNRIIDGVDTKTGRPSVAAQASATLARQGLTGAEVKRRAEAGDEIVQEGLRTGSDAEQMGEYLLRAGTGLVKGTAAVGALVVDATRAPKRALMKALGGPEEEYLAATSATTSAVDRGADVIRRKTGLDGIAIGPAGDLAEFVLEVFAPGPEVIGFLRRVKGGTARADDVIKFYDKKIAETANEAARKALAEERDRIVVSLAPEAPRTPTDIAPPEKVVPAHVEGVFRRPSGAGATAANASEPPRVADEVTAASSDASPLVQAGDGTFDPHAYVREMTEKREAARGVAEAPSASTFVAEAKTKIVDQHAPIEDTVYRYVRERRTPSEPPPAPTETARTIVGDLVPLTEGETIPVLRDGKLLPSRDIRNAIDRSIMSNEIAGQFLRDNGFDDIIRNVPDVAELEQYAAAKHAISVMSQRWGQFIDDAGNIQRSATAALDADLPTGGRADALFNVYREKFGRDLVSDAKMVNALADEYEPFAQQLHDYGDALLTYSVDSGLVSSDLADGLRKIYPYHVPLERVFSVLEAEAGRGIGAGHASLSRQTVMRELEGSKRQIESPVTSLIERTYTAFSQGERNKAAQLLASYAKLPDNPLQLKPLVTREAVEGRMQLATLLKEIGQENRATARQLQTSERAVRGIGRDLERAIDEMEALADEASARAAELAPQSEVNSILDRVVTRERRIHELLADLQASPSTVQPGGRAKTVQSYQGLRRLLKEGVEDAKALRAELRSHANARKTLGRDTISFLNGGVREVWETTPEIAAAAKALNVEQMGVLGRILAVPARVLKLGATGLNLPFLARNPIKDIPTAIINADAGVKVVAEIGRGIFEAVRHGDFYDDLMRQGGMFTSFDQFRTPTQETMASIRSTRSAGSRAKYLVTHPGELFRAVEDIVSRSEQVTRIAVGSAEYKRAIESGLPPEEAIVAAKQASLWATGPFHRHGEWGRVIGPAAPYLNAGIQGQRVTLAALRKRPVETFTKMAATTLMPVAIATAWALKDPERKAAWDDIQTYEKDNNVIIVPPAPAQDEKGNWNVIKIPLPPGVAKWATLLRRPMEAAADLDPVKFGEVASALLGTASPVSTASEVGANVVPQAVKPALEVSLNRDFFRRADIVPQYMQSKPPAEQVFDRTSGTARLLAKVTGLSPIEVEHLVRGYGAGVGVQGLNAVDRALAAIGVIPEDQVGGEDPITMTTRGFTKARSLTERQREARDLRR